MTIPCEFSYTRESRMDPDKRTVHEGIMGIDEKLRRALADDWEFVGDPWQLCHILREEVLAREGLSQQRHAVLSVEWDETMEGEKVTVLTVRGTVEPVRSGDEIVYVSAKEE